MKTVTAHLMEYWEVEELVLKHYGIEYEYLYMNECNNDTAQYFPNVTGEWCEIDEVTSQDSAYDILEFMVKDKHLPSGNYIIDICW